MRMMPQLPPQAPSPLVCWIRAGVVSSIFVLAALALLALVQGLPPWSPINATTHAVYGPDEALAAGADLGHTGLGLVINVAACFVWSAGAVVLALALVRSGGRAGRGSAWIAGLGTAAIAGLVDYALLPTVLRPGWELVLPAFAVVLTFVALGIGMAIPLRRLMPGVRQTAAPRVSATIVPPPPVQPGAQNGLATPEALRHPQPGVIDQRQTRIDPANTVTVDQNAEQSESMKQPGHPDEDQAQTGPEIRVAGRKQMKQPPRQWDIVDEESDESFPAGDPPGNY